MLHTTQQIRYKSIASIPQSTLRPCALQREDPSHSPSVQSLLPLFSLPSPLSHAFQKDGFPRCSDDAVASSDQGAAVAAGSIVFISSISSAISVSLVLVCSSLALVSATIVLRVVISEAMLALVRRALPPRAFPPD